MMKVKRAKPNQNVDETITTIEEQYEQAKLRLDEARKQAEIQAIEQSIDNIKSAADQAHEEMNKKYGTINTDILKKSEKWYTWKGIKSKFRRQMHPDALIVANFELDSGDWDTCVLPIKNDRVIYKNKPYMITSNFKYYNNAFKLWCLDYHESISLPIQRRIPIKDIKNALAATGGHNVVSATNPSTLRQFLMSDVIQSAIQAADISSFFKQVRLIVIITGLLVLIHLLLFLHNNGYLNKLPGIGG